jgi:hypothetical protein
MTTNRLQARVYALAAFTTCAVGGIAYADIPDSNGIVHGCYKSSSTDQGALRVIDREAGQTCRNNENALQWAQAYAAPAKTNVNQGAGNSLIFPGDFNLGAATVSITAPVKGRVLVNGMTTVQGLDPGNTFMAARLREDATGLLSSIQSTTVPSGTSGMLSVVWLFDVSAGEHVFALDLRGVGTYNSASNTITAIFVPD